MPAPTLSGPRQSAPVQSAGHTAQSNQAAAPVIPFTRASRKKSRLIGQFGPTVVNANVQAQPPIALPAAGFLARIRLTVVGTTTANAAAVVFQNDAPFVALQQVSLLTASGDTVMGVVDGFTLAMYQKYGAFATGTFDPVIEPNYSVVTGVGAGAGGSFQFNVTIPVELDSRDAFCTLQNMAANQSFLLQYAINNVAQIYKTAPTTAPSITVTAVMEYYSAPATNNADGAVQATFPPGNGSVSLLQTQTPVIAPSTQQNIQLINVGNTIRFAMFILRDAAGVRTEVDWPAATNFYVNGDPWLYKTAAQWRADLAQQYNLRAGIAATPTANALDAGVFILTDFMNDGASGGKNVDGTSNRNQFLVTGSATAFNVEAVNWGAAAKTLLVVENVIRPSSPSAMYQPFFI